MILDTIRGLVASLGIAEDDNCYAGKLDAKKEKSIGVYHLKRNGKPMIPLGGMEYSSYGVYPVSILIHWDRYPANAERVAKELFSALIKLRDVRTSEETIKFCTLLVPEPQDIGTDEHGIHELVIEVLFYYERS